jgi:nucleotide-binding universal stress UspA family protein
VQHGSVHETIISHAHSCAADLMVLGTHGRGGFHRLFLGSVTEKVIRTATCPVMTIPPSAAAPLDAPVAFRNVLCAIDYSRSSLAALRYALELARQSNGSVTVLHTLEYMDPAEPCEHVDAGVRAARRHIIEHARDRLHQTVAGEPRTWCAIQEVLALNAHRAHEILSRAAASADLIVMGAQGSAGVELMLYGSNTHQVVRRATCPVLTVRQ